MLRLRSTDDGHRSPLESARELDLDAPRLVMPGRYQVQHERTVRDSLQSFREHTAYHAERQVSVPALVPFVHVYAAGSAIPFTFDRDSLKSYVFLGEHKTASSHQNWNAFLALLSAGPGTVVDTSLESFRGTAIRPRMDAASRLLYHAGRRTLASTARESRTASHGGKLAKGESKETTGKTDALPKTQPAAEPAPDQALGPGDVVAIVGLGRVGQRIGRILRERGAVVRGTRRSPAEASSVAADLVLPLDLAAPSNVARLLEGARALVYAAAPDQGPRSYETVYGSGLRTVLVAARAAGVERILVLGSVGVYGEDAGGEVDEETPPEPKTDNARTLFAGEDLVRDAGGVVLRLAGLYARGRGPQRALAQAPRSSWGAPRLSAPGERVVNLVHEADAALATLGVLDRFAERGAQSVFNVSDGEHLTRSRFYELVARALDIPAPVFDLPFERGSAGLGKRVASVRIRELLRGLSFPRFASFEAALAAGELT